jgi:hypothetical protein
MAVLAMAGLAFFFLKRKQSKNGSAELGSSNYDEPPAPPEKYAYHTELPGTVAASELAGNSYEPQELYGDTITTKGEKREFK